MDFKKENCNGKQLWTEIVLVCMCSIYCLNLCLLLVMCATQRPKLHCYAMTCFTSVPYIRYRYVPTINMYLWNWYKIECKIIHLVYPRIYAVLFYCPYWTRIYRGSLCTPNPWQSDSTLFLSNDKLRNIRKSKSSTPI